MTKKALSIALGMMLMAAGAADASRTDEGDVQAPRTGSAVLALRGAAEEVQAPRDEEVQAPRDEEVQAPRGL